MKHRLILLIAFSVGVISLVGTFLVSASKRSVLKSASRSTREEVVRPSDRGERFCIASIKRKGVKATLALDQPEPARTGQSATLLPDGRLLLVGGEGPDGPLTTVEIKDPNTGQIVTLDNGLQRARAWHSATMLPDGSVLIWGGIDAKRQLVETGELFNAQTQRFEPLVINGLTPRAYHTATLLMDEHVLLAGGISGNGRLTRALELLDLKTRSAVTLPDALITERQKHSAYFMPDGNVLLWGGFDQNGNNIESGEIFDTEKQSLSLAGDYARQVDAGAPYMTASSPKDGEMSVPKDSRVAMRFSKPLRVETVNDQTVTLSGPQGQVIARVIPAENGMLAFVTPNQPLLAASMYALSLSNATDKDNAAVPPTTITFMTVGGEMQEHAAHQQMQNGSDKGPPEFDTPNSDNRWRSLPPLQAAPGVTAFAGQVLRVNDQPLPNVTIQIGERAVRTDSTGRFLLTDVPSGHQEFLINGETASRPRKLYATCEEGVDIVSGRTNVLPYTIWLPVVDTHHATPLPVPTTREIVATNPLMPGLEMHIPAGVRLRTHNGTYLTSLALTPVPLDRTPLPLPPGTAYYFTPQTHDSVIETVDGRPSVGIRIVFPNVSHFPPGTQVELFDYSSQQGWYVYGQGTVTRDGRQVVPNPGVGLQRLNCNNSMRRPPPPGKFPPPGGGASAADPVDLGTGLFVYRKTDLALPDTIPIALTRTYRQDDGVPHAFGVGAMHPYEMYLWLGFWSYVDLILPDGGRIHYDEESPGTFVYHHTATPTMFYKSTLTRNTGDGSYDLRLLDGTTYHFFSVLVCCNQLVHQYETGLDWIQDRYGNRLTISRDSNLQITRITTPNGRWVSFTYDGSGHIAQALDSAGRTVSYTYDATFRLQQVTDANGGINQYTYDANSRMLTVKDPRNIVYLTNEYDSNGRVSKQTLADTGFYQFAYTLDGNGNVTQTDVTDPRGNVRRTTFNSNGYTLTDTFALGRPEEQTYTYERQAGSNSIFSLVDSLGRRTALTYDAQGNVTSVTKLAGTPDAVISTATYEPTLNRITSLTDPLNHTTSFTYDSSGNLTTVTDPLNHQATFTYNAAGQLLTATDPMQHTTQFAYDSGDLIATTDPLNYTVTRYIDAAGRVTRVTNPLGAVTSYQYNNLNQPTHGTDPLQGVTAFAYDPNGNLLNITDARNSVTTYIYDNTNRVTTWRDPLLQEDTYQYDLNGNLNQVTDRKGQITNFTYDALNRLTQVTHADTSTTAYTYDAANRLTQVVDSLSGTITYSYDNLDRVTSETTPQGSVSYTYDAAGRRTSMTVAGQPAVIYTYDDANRVTQITQGSATVTIAYDAIGRRTTLTLPNGVVTEYGYDQSSHLTSLTYTHGVTVLGDLTYEYDAAGRRTRMGGSLARNVTPEPVVSATYDAANRQLTFGGKTLSYDLNGNLLSDGTNSYSWGVRNRLLSMNGPDMNASFLYDSVGRRTSKTINGATTSFVYDGADLVQEQSAQLGTANILNGGLDEQFIRSDSSGTLSSLVDGLGSTLSLTDASGAVQTEYSYSAFGVTGTAGTSNNNSSEYTGRENDGTDLYYYRARYYSPALQRFISQDPIGFAGGDVNFYAYVRNDPLSFRDPSGLRRCNPIVGAILGGVVGAVAGGASGAVIGAGAAATVGAVGGTLVIPAFGTVAGAGVGLGPGAMTGAYFGSAIGAGAGIGVGIDYCNGCDKAETAPGSGSIPMVPPMPPGPDNKEGCDKEWADAYAICADMISKGGNRGITGGYTDLHSCARGLVSQRCGGNKIQY